ncbi:hypothetical protein AVEN_222379-1 [Araneus ventricosus]|uniref:Uncharacterized protein n=1 Tax=Araneus ventricosus TaxID=182803 RepID=A0A4Y2EDU7_ARAVE|nr:hypothetical protein AVEN_222379-1 [Araneus ventricosus]
MRNKHRTRCIFSGTLRPEAETLPLGHRSPPYCIGKTKEHHPALPKHPGKQLKDRPPQQKVGHCGSYIIAPITSGSCSNPPFYRGTTLLRKWAQRATPPLLCHLVEESLLTYTAASPPRTHGVPPMGGESKSIGQTLRRDKANAEESSLRRHTKSQTQSTTARGVDVAVK